MYFLDLMEIVIVDPANDNIIIVLLIADIDIVLDKYHLFSRILCMYSSRRQKLQTI